MNIQDAAISIAMIVGSKVHYGEYRNCTVTRVFKNGSMNIECWVQGGFMRKPELWRFRVRPQEVVVA